MSKKFLCTSKSINICLALRTNAPSEEPSGTTAEWTTASAPTIRLSTTSFIQRPPSGESFDDTCVLPLDVGPCTDYVARWYIKYYVAHLQMTYNQFVGILMQKPLPVNHFHMEIATVTKTISSPRINANINAVQVSLF